MLSIAAATSASDGGVIPYLSSSRHGATSTGRIEVLTEKRFKLRRLVLSGIAWGLLTGCVVGRRKPNTLCRRRGDDMLASEAERGGIGFVSLPQKSLPYFPNALLQDCCLDTGGKSHT